MAIQMLIGSIPLAIAAFALEQPLTVTWSLNFVLILLGLSLFGSALVYWLWVSILEKTSLIRANAFSFLVPVFGLTMGAMFYGETLGWPEFVGVVLTLVGIGLVNRKGGHAAKHQLEPVVSGEKVEYKHNEI